MHVYVHECMVHRHCPEIENKKVRQAGITCTMQPSGVLCILFESRQGRNEVSPWSKLACERFNSSWKHCGLVDAHMIFCYFVEKHTCTRNINLGRIYTRIQGALSFKLKRELAESQHCESRLGLEAEDLLKTNEQLRLHTMIFPCVYAYHACTQGAYYSQVALHNLSDSSHRLSTAE